MYESLVKKACVFTVEAKILSFHKFIKLKWKEGTPIRIYSEMKSLCCKCNRIANVAADVWNRISQLKVLETFWDIVPEIIFQNKYALLVLVSSHRKNEFFWEMRVYFLALAFTFSVKPCVKLIHIFMLRFFKYITCNEAKIRWWWLPPVVLTVRWCSIKGIILDSTISR